MAPLRSSCCSASAAWSSRVSNLSKCLTEARLYWDGADRYGQPQPREGIQSVRARVCVELVGGTANPRKLTPKDAAKLLRELKAKGLARKTVADYYSTFKRMLALNDQFPSEGYARWPKPPSPPRRCREPISSGDLKRVVDRLHARNFGATGQLALLLNAMGGRVQREVLLKGNLRYRTRDGVVVVFIEGKGGHERLVPVTDSVGIEILTDKESMRAILAVPYKTHLDRWNVICGELGIKGLATFHHIRHKYATEVLGRTKNLRLVQDLLGHANPATTAIYAHVSLDDKVKALTE